MLEFASRLTKIIGGQFILNLKIMSEKKEKQTRTPRNLESITAGAMSLSLEERVTLCKALKESITKEVEEKEQGAKQAKELVNGL